MPASEPFIGLYAKVLKDFLPCLTGQEWHVFLAVAAHVAGEGESHPGVRLLADLTAYSTTVVAHVLVTLQEKGLIVCLRKDGRDPITKILLPDAYAVNPNLVMVSDPSLWHEFRFRNAYMPESLLREELTQADSTTEAEPEKYHQRSSTTGPEGAAMLPPIAMRTPNKPGSQNAGPDSAAGSQRQPNSTPRSIRRSGAAVAAVATRELSFSERVATEAIRRQVPDMSHEKAAELVVLYGIDQFNAAVLAMKERDKKVPIVRKTGWIIRNLQAGAKGL